MVGGADVWGVDGFLFVSCFYPPPTHFPYSLFRIPLVVLAARQPPKTLTETNKNQIMGPGSWLAIAFTRQRHDVSISLYSFSPKPAQTQRKNQDHRSMYSGWIRVDLFSSRGAESREHFLLRYLYNSQSSENGSNTIDRWVGGGEVVRDANTTYLITVP